MRAHRNHSEKCIRLNPHVVALFQRANLVYFRNTIHTPDMLTSAVLAAAKKRSYANYPFVRTADIWASRQDLIAYEGALAIEAKVDQLLEGTTFNTGRGRSTVSKTPAVEVKEEPQAQESERVQNARQVKEILDVVYPNWCDLVAVKGDVDPRRRGLERFDCGACFTAHPQCTLVLCYASLLI